MPNIIESYLVSLGFSVSNQELRKFNEAIEAAGKAVQHATGGFVADIIKWQVAVTGAFAGIAGALIGLADHVAEEDQSFRLFGLRMNMTADHAKSLKVAMDALGQPLEVIAWDPEIHGRFLQLIDDQKQLQAGLGNGRDFEEQMRTIRDVRFEFTRLRVELQYLGMSLISNLFKGFGTSIDGVLTKLREWNDWIIKNLPQLGEQFATYLTPILKETWQIGQDLWDALKAGALAFTNLVGLLSGDTSIEASTLKFDNMAKAVGHVTANVSDLLHGLTDLEATLAHTISMISLLLAGKFSEAGAEGKEVLKYSGALKPSIDLQHPFDVPGGGSGSASSENIAKMIVEAAKAAGIDPHLAIALAKTESGIRQFDAAGGVLKSSAGALGVMQLMPGTASGLGVDPNDTGQNIKGGTQYLAALLKQFRGDTTLALEAYNWGPANVAKALKNHTEILPAAQQYAATIERGGGSITVGDVHVHVAGSNASADEIGNVVIKRLNAMRDQEYARASAQHAY